MLLFFTLSNKWYIIIWIMEYFSIFKNNHICFVMVSILSSSWLDRGFKCQSGQSKDYKIGICCFSTKHPALRSKSKYWLGENQDNVSLWSDMYTRGLLFQSASTIKIQLCVLFYYKTDIITTCFCNNITK